MLHGDTIDFVGYSTVQPSICESGALRLLVSRYLNLGYTLTKGLPYPFDDPNNRLITGDEVDQAIRNACNFSHRRRTLHFWRAPFAFSVRLSQPLTGVIEWTLFVQSDTLLGLDNNLGEQNAAEFMNVVIVALETLPTYYGCLYTSQHPPSVEDVIRGVVSKVYPANYFGDSFLGLVEREKLSGMPAWLNETVGSGRLVVPSIKALYADDDLALQEANRYLFGRVEPSMADEQND